jgi:hypothetical protein
MSNNNKGKHKYTLRERAKPSKESKLSLSSSTYVRSIKSNFSLSICWEFYSCYLEREKTFKLTKVHFQGSNETLECTKQIFQHRYSPQQAVQKFNDKTNRCLRSEKTTIDSPFLFRMRLSRPTVQANKYTEIASIFNRKTFLRNSFSLGA